MSYWIQIGKDKIDLSAISTAKVSLEQRPGGWLVFTFLNKGVKKKYKVRTAKEKQKLYLLFQGWSFVAQFGEKSIASSIDVDLETHLKAQFPGKVRKILIQEGSAVQEGDKLILLEAMKMEFAVQAPFQTKVLKIAVKENEQVSPGALLVELAPPKDGGKNG